MGRPAISTILGRLSGPRPELRALWPPVGRVKRQWVVTAYSVVQNGVGRNVVPATAALMIIGLLKVRLKEAGDGRSGQG